MSQIILFLLTLAIIIPVGVFFIGERKPKTFKKMLGINIISFFGILVVGTIFMFTAAMASGAVAESAVHASPGVTVAAQGASGMGYLAAALSTGLSCVGAGIAVSSAAAAALGALSENEGIMGKAMIFVALAEGVAIYGLIISIMILGRV